MSSQIALSKTSNDLIKLNGGGIGRVDKGRFVVQQVSSKLKTILGEWLLDTSVGFLNLSDFSKNSDLFDLETRAVEIILETDNVKSINSINFTQKDRTLNIKFTASTTFGDIDVEIPWDNTGN